MFWGTVILGIFILMLIVAFVIGHEARQEALREYEE